MNTEPMSEERLKTLTQIYKPQENYSQFAQAIVVECLAEIHRLRGLVESLQGLNAALVSRRTKLDCVATDGGKVTTETKEKA